MIDPNSLAMLFALFEFLWYVGAVVVIALLVIGVLGAIFDSRRN